ncbi:DNA polymerase thumb domain-containing protein, partial [Pseudomonas syringae group genomosp. 7]
SAGIAPNKFLAKIASDWRKPDGQFVIPPQRVDAFLLPLPVNRVPGVGKVMEGKLAARGIVTCGDLRQWALIDLEEAFGSFG